MISEMFKPARTERSLSELSALTDDEEMSLSQLHVPVSPNEPNRIRVLRETNILDSNTENENFDRLTIMAARIFKMPIALVSLVDVNRLWLKSRVGMPVHEVTRDFTLCNYTILEESPEVFVVNDAKKDPRSKSSPFVRGPPFIRFYAAAPLIFEGIKLGTFCLIDQQAHADFDLTQQHLLKDFSSLAVELIYQHQRVSREVRCDVPRLSMVLLQHLQAPLMITREQQERVLQTYTHLTPSTKVENKVESEEETKQGSVQGSALQPFQFQSLQALEIEAEQLQSAVRSLEESLSICLQFGITVIQTTAGTQTTPFIEETAVTVTAPVSSRSTVAALMIEEEDDGQQTVVSQVSRDSGSPTAACSSVASSAAGTASSRGSLPVLQEQQLTIAAPQIMADNDSAAETASLTLATNHHSLASNSSHISLQMLPAPIVLSPPVSQPVVAHSSGSSLLLQYTVADYLAQVQRLVQQNMPSSSSSSSSSSNVADIKKNKNNKLTTNMMQWRLRPPPSSQQQQAAATAVQPAQQMMQMILHHDPAILAILIAFLSFKLLPRCQQPMLINLAVFQLPPPRQPQQPATQPQQPAMQQQQQQQQKAMIQVDLTFRQLVTAAAELSQGSYSQQQQHGEDDEFFFIQEVLQVYDGSIDDYSTCDDEEGQQQDGKGQSKTRYVRIALPTNISWRPVV